MGCSSSNLRNKQIEEKKKIMIKSKTEKVLNKIHIKSKSLSAPEANNIKNELELKHNSELKENKAHNNLTTYPIEQIATESRNGFIENEPINENFKCTLGTEDPLNKKFIKISHIQTRESLENNTEIVISPEKLLSQRGSFCNSGQKLAFFNESQLAGSANNFQMSMNGNKNPFDMNMTKNELSFLDNTDFNNNMISINIVASKFENMYPIWVEEGKMIHFFVSGKWTSDDSMPYVDSVGHNNSNDEFSNTFNNAALVGRILGGDYFAVLDNMVYESKISGPLFLKMHLNKLKCSPKGVLNIKINGVLDMPFPNIDEKLGWEANMLFHNPKSVVISNLEKQLIILINKLRTNSVMFAQQYIENIRYFANITNHLYNDLISNTKKFQPLQLKDELINSIKNNESSTTNSKKHEDNKPLSILIKLLFDEKIKNNILSNKYSELGIFFKPADNLSKYNTTFLLFKEDNE